MPPTHPTGLEPAICTRQTAGSSPDLFRAICTRCMRKGGKSAQCVADSHREFSVLQINSRVKFCI